MVSCNGPDFPFGLHSHLTPGVPWIDFGATTTLPRNKAVTKDKLMHEYMCKKGDFRIHMQQLIN